MKIADSLTHYYYSCYFVQSNELNSSFTDGGSLTFDYIQVSRVEETTLNQIFSLELKMIHITNETQSRFIDRLQAHKSVNNKGIQHWVLMSYVIMYSFVQALCDHQNFMIMQHNFHTALSNHDKQIVFLLS